MSDPNAMTTLVGRMKVEELARFTGLRIEELVEAVLGQQPSQPFLNLRPLAHERVRPRPQLDGAPRLRTTPAAPSSELSVAEAPLPELTELVGRASYRRIHRAVNRWLLGSVWEQEAHNVTRAARRLEISRRRFRDLFASAYPDEGRAVDSGELALPLEPQGDPSQWPAPPPLESLLAQGTYREVHDAVDRWLLERVLEWTQGNLTHAARHLDVSRKHLREHLARVGLR